MHVSITEQELRLNSTMSAEKQKGPNIMAEQKENGLPMCPMPVFFKFDLQEVLAKHPDLCYYSRC